jgi:[NiFe] hydrogenase diaphorase moiety small subunit
MSDHITFTIDGKECRGAKGQTIVEAARDNGVYIPVLCHYDGLKPAGACRICTVRVGGRTMAACTTPIAPNIVVQSNIPELEDMRKAIVEMLFVEGNHMCPTCEKSGNCELQALGYRYAMLAPRFPYLWPVRQIDASAPKLYIDTNRCVQCLRCARGVLAPDGRRIFGLVRRGERTVISADPELAAVMTDEQARKAMDLCPVGALLRKEVGFAVPVGRRKYDTRPIGSEIEGR